MAVRRRRCRLNRSYPANANSLNVRSLNDVLGEGVLVGSTVTWSFVRMAPYTVLYLRSNRLRCENHHGPRQFFWLGANGARPRLLVLGARLTPSLMRLMRRILRLFWHILRVGRVWRGLRGLRVLLGLRVLKGLVNIRGFDRHF